MIDFAKILAFVLGLNYILMSLINANFNFFEWDGSQRGILVIGCVLASAFIFARSNSPKDD